MEGVRSTSIVSICMCYTTHSYTWRDSPIRVIWFICVTWLKYVKINVLMEGVGSIEWVMSHMWMSHIEFNSHWIQVLNRILFKYWCDSFTCETWLIHMCDMTHSYVWHDSFTCVTLLIWIQFEHSAPDRFDLRENMRTSDLISNCGTADVDRNKISQYSSAHFQY